MSGAQSIDRLDKQPQEAILAVIRKENKAVITTQDTVEVMSQYRRASIFKREEMRQAASIRYAELKKQKGRAEFLNKSAVDAIDSALKAIVRFQHFVKLDDDLQINYMISLLEGSDTQ